MNAGNDEDELDAIRRRKLEELQARQQQQTFAEEERKAVDAQRQLILRQILTPEARERLGRLRIARPEVVHTVENQLIMLAQSGRLDRQIDDNTLRQILGKLVPEKREIKIERR